MSDCNYLYGKLLFGMEGEEDLKVEYTIVLKR